MKNIALNETKDALVILDQTRLPGETVFLTLQSREEIVSAIRRLAVRGAPAIGIAAAYAYALSAREILLSAAFRASAREALPLLEQAKDELQSSRPTAVNLAWALSRMHLLSVQNAGLPGAQLLSLLFAEAEGIHREDAACNRRISEYGLALLKEGDGVITHCNAGPLATSEYGTALGPLLLAKERGIHLRIYADETRPLLQGARLTAWELKNAGADVTLLCDNMAGDLMRKGLVQAVFVGCDRAAANGDCANKIGTYSLSVLARYHGIPVYFLLPSSTVDLACPTGADIPVEQRDGEELISLWYSHPMAPAGVKTYNPAFDVTPHTLITGIVTEYGVITPPFDRGLARIIKEKENTANA